GRRGRRLSIPGRFTRGLSVLLQEPAPCGRAAISDLEGLPADSRMTLDELTARIDECTGIAKSAAARTELQKNNLANILAVGGFRESVLIRHMQYGTFNFRDIANITHGKSPFSNMHSVYRGSDDDDALNRGVIRFEADAAGIAALKADAEPKVAL